MTGLLIGVGVLAWFGSIYLSVAAERRWIVDTLHFSEPGDHLDLLTLAALMPPIGFLMHWRQVKQVIRDRDWWPTRDEDTAGSGDDGITFSVSFGPVHPNQEEDDDRPLKDPDLPRESQTEEIIGWRGWNIGRDEDGRWQLLSTYTATPWTGPVLTEPDELDEVGRGSSAVTFQQASRWRTHGIYALKPLRVKLGGYAVVGEVRLSGKVIEHEKGYRAERATVHKLYPLPSARATMLQIGRGTAVMYLAAEQGTIPDDLTEHLEERYECEVDPGKGRQMLEAFTETKNREPEDEEDQWTSANPSASSKSSLYAMTSQQTCQCRSLIRSPHCPIHGLPNGNPSPSESRSRPNSLTTEDLYGAW